MNPHDGQRRLGWSWISAVSSSVAQCGQKVNSPGHSCAWVTADSLPRPASDEPDSYARHAHMRARRARSCLTRAAAVGGSPPVFQQALEMSHSGKQVLAVGTLLGALESEDQRL